MWRNYLAAALRNLSRNRLYAAIKVIGLSIGFAAAILIALFVWDELSYERWISGHERTFLVSQIIRLAGVEPIVTPSSPVELAGWLRTDFPEIEAIARVHPARASIRRGEKEFSEEFGWADAELFRVLPFPAVAGALSDSLTRPDGIVLTRKVAEKYFGRHDVIGETLEIDRQQVFTVTAVLEDFPSNTHFPFQILASGKASFSWLTIKDARPPPLASGGNEATVYTYLRLKPGASVDAVRARIPKFIQRHAQQSPGSFEVDFPILPIADIHLHPPVGNDSARSAPLNALYASIVIALLIVAIAGVNFVNLMTARADRRATEVGIRKACGARRRDLVLQFIGECLVYCALALVVALAFVEGLLPFFNAFLDRQIEFNYWEDLRLTGGVLGLTIFMAVLAGTYPALVLASLRPSSMLGMQSSKRSGGRGVRRGLVILQIAGLMGLLLATGTVYRQHRFALDESFGVVTDQVVAVETTCPERFKHAVLALPGVASAACSASLPTIPAQSQSSAIRADQPELTMWWSAVDYGFFELYGLAPLAGRFFRRDRTGDELTGPPFNVKPEAVILNETAVRKLGFASPAAAIGQTFTCGHAVAAAQFTNMHTCEIIGVVADFIEGSIREVVPPSAYYLYPSQFMRLSIKLNGRDVPRTLAAIDRLWKAHGDAWPILRAFVDQRIADQYRGLTRQAQLFAVFSGLALVVACLGLFGLSAFTAEQRTREIGVRKALGAESASIVRLLLWQFSQPVLWATLLAWPIAGFLMHRWLEGFAYRVRLEPALFVLSTMLALAIALLTVSVHSILVSRTKPVEALRYE